MLGSSDCALEVVRTAAATRCIHTRLETYLLDLVMMLGLYRLPLLLLDAARDAFSGKKGLTAVRSGVAGHTGVQSKLVSKDSTQKYQYPASGVPPSTLA